MEVKRDAIKTTIFDSFDDAESVWRRFEREGECYAFQSFGWLKDWYTEIGCHSSVRPCIVSVECTDGTPLMLLPLAIQRRGLVSCLEWLGGTISDYQGPIVSNDLSDKISKSLFLEIWKDVLAKLPRFNAVLLENQPEYINKQKNPFMHLPCEPHASSAYFTQISGTLDSFLKEKRSSKSRSTERRKFRRLAEHGTLEFVVTANEEDIDSTLNTMFEQKSESYKEMGVTDLFEQSIYRDFFKSMTEHYVRDGFIQLCALKLDEQILATHWGMVFKNRFYFFMPTYARGELARYAPGNLLMQHMFDWCLSNDVQIFDFTVGDEPYKKLWCDERLDLYNSSEARTFLGLFYVWLVRIRWRLKRKIKHSPGLFKAASRLRKSLARFKH